MPDRHWRITHGARPALSDTRRQWHRSHRGGYGHRNGGLGLARVQMQVPVPAAQNTQKDATSPRKKSPQRCEEDANSSLCVPMTEAKRHQWPKSLAYRVRFQYFLVFEVAVSSCCFARGSTYDDVLGIKGNEAPIGQRESIQTKKENIQSFKPGTQV